MKTLTKEIIYEAIDGKRFLRWEECRDYEAALSKGGSLGTNKRPSVEEVIKFLQKFPDNMVVWGYEGEGGSWIIVGEKEDANDHPPEPLANPQ